MTIDLVTSIAELVTAPATLIGAVTRVETPQELDKQAIVSEVMVRIIFMMLLE